jgi:NAD(P)-dependent dehydrogenase (short-subunit alcohol dehydrogenase family)
MPSFDDWDFALGVNLRGVVNALGTFLPRILRHGEPAHVVATASMSGLFHGGSAGVHDHEIRRRRLDGSAALCAGPSRDRCPSAASASWQRGSSTRTAIADPAGNRIPEVRLRAEQKTLRHGLYTSEKLRRMGAFSEPAKATNCTPKSANSLKLNPVCKRRKRCGLAAGRLFCIYVCG